MTDFYREFGVRVRDARGPKSQTDLARDAGLSRALIANIEIGRNRVTLDVLDRLARALDVEPVDLLPNIPAAGSPLDRRNLQAEDQTAIERIRRSAGLATVTGDG